MNRDSNTYRYIIIGAGSAGCVLADRLSEDPANAVLLLEAGGRDLHPFIHMPAGIARLVHNRRINWHYETEPERELCGRRLYWPRGKVLGGSSSINAMCYVRGQAQDYDDWEAAGNQGWSFGAVLPYFVRAERQMASRLTGSPYHGTTGKLSVEDLRDVNPLSRTFIAAAKSLGIEENDDFNGPTQRGVGLYQVTQSEGRRCSAAVAYLRAARERPNLTIATHRHVTRILFERGRAVGVEALHRGRAERFMFDGEVILCAGAINSPQLLLLSGIGEPEHLQAFGISTIAALPGVGCNLQDHLDVCLLQKCTQPITYDFSLLDEARVGLRYLISRRGPGVSNVAEAGGFISTPYATAGRPDVQLHFVPAQLDDHGRNRLSGHGYTLHACYLKPHSRGRISLQSNDPLSAPRIEANYLQEGRDLTAMIAVFRLGRDILNARPFDSVRGVALYPDTAESTDATIADFIRRRAETVYHPVGTCRMGNDEHAVVDSHLRVRGIENLRVADASVMPTIISGNTNAPTIMIAERCADLLLEPYEHSTTTSTPSLRPSASAGLSYAH